MGIGAVARCGWSYAGGNAGMTGTSSSVHGLCLCSRATNGHEGPLMQSERAYMRVNERGRVSVFRTGAELSREADDNSA